MSDLSKTSKHDWDFYWTDLVGDSAWAAAFAEEDRMILELESEAMVRISIPRNLACLKQAYDACRLSDDLHKSVKTAAYCKEDMDLREVKSQMEGMTFKKNGEVVRNGGKFVMYDGTVIQVQPIPTLLCPEHFLATFISELKLCAFMTIWSLLKDYKHFLDSLDVDVREALQSELLHIAIEELLDHLCHPGPAKQA